MKRTESILILRSDLSELERLHRLIVDYAHESGMPEDVRSRLELALDEAVTNAILHGNAQDPSKSVRIRISVGDDGWRCRVEDEGEGFDAEDLPDPTHEETLMEPHGRGVFLIRELSDEARFLDGGRIVEMVFRPR